LTPYYERDGIVLYVGDCREILTEMATDSVDLVLTDPPYGVGLDYGGGVDDREFRLDWIEECRRVSRGPVVFTVPSTKLFDLPRPDWIGCWHKPRSFGFWATPFYPHWEAIVFYGMAGKYLRSDVWTANTEKPNGHPAPKPIALWRELLACLPGDLVLDPFLGSGTTLRATKDLGRRGIGIEINPDYAAIAVARLSQEVLTISKYLTRQS
jgi:site-specific DNA-methyltransferase (adenine-specific)